MSQPKTYELARIAMDDTFSTQPLNDNAEVVENALNSLDADRTDLLSRVAALEVRKMAFGTYYCEGGTFTVNTGFTPKIVFILSTGQTSRCAALVSGLTTALSVEGSIVTNGFQIITNGHTTRRISYSNERFAYLAVA